MRILDVGGGYSTIGKLIVEDFGAEYWIIDDFGVESSEPIWSRYGSREELRKSNPDINYIFGRMCKDVSSILEDDFFDIVLSISTLEHIPPQNRSQIFEDMVRVTNKTAGLMISTIDVSESNLVEWDGLLRAFYDMHCAKEELPKISAAEFNAAGTLYETSEVIFRHYPPNEKVKKYSRIGCLGLSFLLLIHQ